VGGDERRRGRMRRRRISDLVSVAVTRRGAARGREEEEDLNNPLNSSQTRLFFTV
jgi:hypothetical protein